MSSFTYEWNKPDTELETYEWDNVWIDQANDRETKRVLYIGDSISCGTRRLCTEVADGEYLFDGFGTSKAVDNPYFLDSVRLFAAQEKKREVIIFNNGLHGWHLDDEIEYASHYEQLLTGIAAALPNTPVYVVLTTSVEDAEREERVITRNRVAREIAEKHGMSVIDLYSVSVENVALRTSDGVHFSADGCRRFAERIVADIRG